MSVVVMNMEMPECCLCCRLFAGNGCVATGKIFNDLFNVACRPDGCPLRPLPEKHGRLVDADKLESAGYALSRLHIDTDAQNPKQMIWRELIPFDEAPAIIEAEGGSGND